MTLLLMLLADAQPCPSLVTSLVALGGTIATAAATVVGIYLTVRHNGRIGTLEHRADTCEEDRERCREELAEAKSELKAKDEEDKEALEAKIAELKAEVDKKKDETGEHKPA